MRNYLAIILTIIFIIELVKANNTVEKLECLIENSRYENEYLYAARDPKSSLNTNTSLNTKQTKHTIFSIFDFSIKEKDPVKWIFIQLNDSFDTYYLKNEKTNEYMCASSNVIDKGFEMLFSMTKKRLIYSMKIANDLEKQKRNQISNLCKWQFKQTKSDRGSKSYIIRNVQYKDPIQIDPHLQRINGKYSRSIYLKAKQSEQDELSWIVHC